MSETIDHASRTSQGTIESFRFNETLGDPATRRDYFANLEPVDFIDLVQETAHVIRTGENGPKQHFDGDKVFLHTFEVPNQREKEGLLELAWEAARAHLQNNSLSDEDALDRAATIVSGGLLYAHPFIDGNGRTSRALSYIIAKGTNEPEQLSKIISESDVRGGWSNAPMNLRWAGQERYAGDQPDVIEWDQAFAGEGQDALGGVIANGFNSDSVIRTFIERNDQYCQDALSKSVKEVDGKAVLHAQTFINELVNDEQAGMTNAKDLLDIKREKSAKVVAGYIGSMVSEKEYPIIPRLQSAIDSFSTHPRRGPVVTALVGEFLEKHSKKAGEENKMSLADQQVLYNKIYSTIEHAEVGNAKATKKSA